LNPANKLVCQKHYRYNYNPDIFTDIGVLTDNPWATFCTLDLILSNTMYVVY